MLEQLAAFVQSVADANPDHAAAIIESARFPIARTGGRLPQSFHVEQTDNTGTATVYVPVFDADATYFVQYSPDQKTYIDVPESMKTKISLPNLPVHTTIWVRYRASGRHGRLDWSDPISYFVL